jgi:hypothetical protein
MLPFYATVMLRRKSGRESPGGKSIFTIARLALNRIIVNSASTVDEEHKRTDHRRWQNLSIIG